MPYQDFGGTEKLSFPETFRFDFGTFSLINFYPAATIVKGDCKCNLKKQCYNPLICEALAFSNSINILVYHPVAGYLVAVNFFDPVGTTQRNHVWGQGAALCINKIRVMIETCDH